MKKAHEIVDQFTRNNRMPGVYHRIRALVASPDTSLSAYIETIVAEPELAALVVNVAKSSLFNESRKIDTLEQAVSHIGVMQLKDILLCSFSIKAFASIPDSIVNLPVYWKNSVLSGIIAYFLARRCAAPTSSQYFTLGMLHDIGHLVMYSIIPDQTLEIFAKIKNSKKSVNLIEIEQLGFDYAQVGRDVMAQWSFPESYQQVTLNHPNPRNAAQFYFETAIIHIARSICLQGEDAKPTRDNRIQPIAWSLTNLTPIDIDGVREQALQYIDEMLSSLHIPSASPNKVSQIK